jgi:hypothetical protein
MVERLVTKKLHHVFELTGMVRFDVVPGMPK